MVRDELIHRYHLAYAVRFQYNAASNAVVRQFVDMFVKEHGIGVLADIMHGSFKGGLSDADGSDYMWRELYKVIAPKTAIVKDWAEEKGVPIVDIPMRGE